MAAQQLPLETLLLIFSFISESLAPFASVCRSWQIAVEKITFADVHLDPSALAQFHDTVRRSGFERCGHIKRLHYKVLLQEYSVAARGRYENQHDRRHNNEIFTHALSSLLKTLSLWPSSGNNSISLELYSRSPSDWRACEDWAERRIRQQTAVAFPERELLDKRWESSYLELTERIPFTAGCIDSFRVLGHPGYRHFAPSAISEIVSLLPRIRNVEMVLNDDEKKDIILRDRLRDGKPSPCSRSPLQLFIRCSFFGFPLWVRVWILSKMSESKS